MDAWLPVLVFAIVLTGSGFVQSSLGFGYAVVAMSILPYFVDVRLANLALSLSVIIPTILAVRAYRHELDWRALAWSLAGAALLLPLGLVAFAYLSAGLLVRATGFAILLVTLLELRSSRSAAPRAATRWMSALAGAVSGFLTGAVGIGGPPIAAYAIRQSWSPARFKAFVLGFLLVLSLAKAVGVVVTGWVDQTVLLYGTLAIPFAMLGSYLGVVVSRRFDPQRFRYLILVVLLLNSGGMLLSGTPTAGGDVATTSPVPRGNWQPRTRAAGKRHSFQLGLLRDEGRQKQRPGLVNRGIWPGDFIAAKGASTWFPHSTAEFR